MRIIYQLSIILLSCTTQHNRQIVFGGFDIIYIGMNKSLTMGWD